MPCRADRIGEQVSGGIARRRIGLEKVGSWCDSAQVDKSADEAGEQLRVIDGRVEVADIRELTLHVERDLGDTGVEFQRRIPRAPTWTVESIERSRQPI